jgi:glycosyltransferase involved in cell wall biosynthesis
MYMSAEKQKAKLISFLVPVHNESDNVALLYDRLSIIMQPTSYDWEILFVNDGSQDDTLEKILQFRERDARVQVIDLSRNFGKEAALTAGLDYANGDAVIPIDADLQDPPELIPKLLEKWEEGFDIVNAARKTRLGETWFKRLTAHSFYRIINKMSNIKIPTDTGDFRLLSKAVVEELRKLPERRRFMKGLFAWVGFPTATVYYTREPRYAGKTHWNYWKLWNFALEGITSFSHVPLQIATYLGFLVSLFSFIYGIYITLSTLCYGNEVAGYPSLMVTVLFLGGIQLMALGVIGEYMGRVYEESKQRPVYVVRRKWIGE